MLWLDWDPTWNFDVYCFVKLAITVLYNLDIEDNRAIII